MSGTRTFCLVLALTSACNVALAENRVASGRIDEVDLELNTLGVTIKGESLVLRLASDTKFIVDGKPTNLSAMSAPAKATITYDRRTLLATKVSIAKPTTEPATNASAEETDLLAVEIVSAEWRDSYEFTFQKPEPQQPGEFLPSSSPQTVKLTPKRPGEKLIVVRVKCRSQRTLSPAERRVVKKDKKSDLLHLFKADAALTPSSWLLGAFDPDKNSLDLRQPLVSRSVGGDAQTMTKTSPDGKPPETTVFLSSETKAGKATAKVAEMEIVWTHSKADRSPVFVVLPLPSSVAQPTALRLTFSENDKFQSAPPFKNERLDDLAKNRQGQ